MKESFKKLAAIVLAFIMVITFMPALGTQEAYADGTATLTLHFSSIDGDDLVNPIVISGLEPGTTFKEALRKLNGTSYGNKVTIETELFSKEGYMDTGKRLLKSFKEIVKNNESWYNYEADDTLQIDSSISIYYFMAIPIDSIKAIITPPLCGTETTTPKWSDGGDSYNLVKQINRPAITEPKGAHYDFRSIDIDGDEYVDTWWIDPEKHDSYIPFIGTFVGGQEYYAYALAAVNYGYHIMEPAHVDITGGTLISFTDYPWQVSFNFKVKAVHNWDSGKVTKEPTADATGVKTYTCKGCGKTKTESIPKLGSDPTQMGSDGTAVGAGASAAAAEDKITGMKTDKDPKGSKFSMLKLRSTKQTRTSITLKWKSNKKAEKYVIYGNRCGTSTKIRKSVKLYNVKKSTKTTMTKVIKKVKGAAVKKNTYYKFLVVALNKKNEVVSTSRMIHVATKGGKYTNYKKISVDKEKITKAKNLKKGKSLKLEPKQVKVTKSLKARKHVPIRYESSNKSIAKVTSKGVIKALKKGTCYVYVYAQNGVYKKIKVVVK